MSLCINPDCPRPDHPGNSGANDCQACGTPLVLEGRYRVMRLISSQTGFGMVYEAYERDLPKILKVLRREHINHPKILTMFRHEAEVLSRLNHPGLPYVTEGGYFAVTSPATNTPLHCIVMEKIDGLNLAQWMKQQGYHPIHEQQAVGWLTQLVEILHQIHQNNYFHRDIKPENVMIRTSGQLALVDFGAAREVTQTYLTHMSRGGVATAISSAGYTPPEQEQGQAVPQSDFYALGRTLIYLLTAKAPTDTNLYDAMQNRFDWRPYATQISTVFADLLDDMISPRVVDRPTNAQAILTRLQQLSSQESSHAFSQPSPQQAYRVNPQNLGAISQANTGPQVSLGPQLSETTLPVDSNLSPLDQKTALQLGITTPSWQTLPRTFGQRRRRWPWIVAAAVGLALGGGAIALHQRSPSPPPQPVAVAPKVPVQLQRTLPDHSGSINDLLMFANGMRMISAGADQTIRLWDLTSGELLQTWDKQTSYVNTVLLSPDDKQLYSGNADGTLQAWKVASGERLWQQTNAHNGPINTVGRTPDGQQLVSGGADGTIHIWQTSQAELVQSITTNQGSINSLVVTSDGQYIISGGSDRTIKFWHIATGKLGNTLEGHESFVNALTISPDGRFLFSASADGTIRQWQIKTGKLLHTLLGHTSYVNDMIFSRDGRTLSTGSADKTVRIWNVETGAAEQVLTGFGMLIDHVVISSSEQIITASRTTPAIKIWQRDQ